MLIIGILAAVAVPQYQRAVAKARTAEAVAMLKSLVLAEDVYFLANGTFARDISQLDIDVANGQVAPAFAQSNKNTSNKYVYFCRQGGDCTADACNANMPFFTSFPSSFNDTSEYPVEAGGIYCVPRTWTAGCNEKSSVAEEICKSLNISGKKVDKPQNNTTYYRVN